MHCSEHWWEFPGPLASQCRVLLKHDDVIKWKYFPHYWPFARGIHWPPVDSPQKGHWRGVLMFSLMRAWTNAWTNSWDVDDLKRHVSHCDVAAMISGFVDWYRSYRQTTLWDISFWEGFRMYYLYSYGSGRIHYIAEMCMTLQWRHNGRDSVSNHQPYYCLLNCLFKRRSTKTSKLRVTGPCAGNSPVTGEFPAQMACNAENVSIWWRHHENVH